MNNKMYALYKGDQFLFIGTMKEIAEHRGVQLETIRFLNTPAYKKRSKYQHEPLILISAEDDEGEKKNGKSSRRAKRKARKRASKTTQPKVSA